MLKDGVVQIINMIEVKCISIVVPFYSIAFTQGDKVEYNEKYYNVIGIETFGGEYARITLEGINMGLK